jgi:GTP-binding protein HflX
MHEIERDPSKPLKAYLVGIREPEMIDSPEALLDELSELTGNLGMETAGREIVNLRQPTPRFYIGSGKAEEIKLRATELGAETIVFDVQLAPAQQKNLEELFEIAVIDRHQVILDIFADRAQTREAALQVELARAEYMLPRIRGLWGHLNRQHGGGVYQKGEGESQGEIDSRAVRHKITRLKEELVEVTRHREVQRKKRERIPLPSAAIVGYTNAGKSSLLNALTGANVLAENKLFATLDPTTRQMGIPGGGKLLLTDTVGFVRRLPHRLVEAFKATLEEAVVSDFLIHVVDASSPDAERHIQTTMEVLKELNADNKPIIMVYNKADLIDESARIALSGGVFTSILTGQGLDELKTRIYKLAEERQNLCELLIPHDRYDILSTLHEAGCIKTRDVQDEGVRVVCNLPPRLRPLEKEFGSAAKTA